MNKDKIERKIAERAYFYFVERGYEHGHDFEDWVRAEKEILIELGSSKKRKSTRKRTTSSSKRSTSAKSNKSKTTAKGRNRAKSR